MFKMQQWRLEILGPFVPFGPFGPFGRFGPFGI